MMISTKYPVDSRLCEHYIMRLKKRYPFLAVESIGKSVMERDLYVLRLGYGKRRVFICGTHHGLEWITSLILLRFAQEYCDRKERGHRFCSMSVNDAFAETSAYIMPMVNPDGADIAINGVTVTHPRYAELTSMLSGRDPKEVWQANARGVDLNHNYNAEFEKGRTLEAEYNICGAGPTRYGGPYPESEPETRAVCRFLRARRCELAISYHTQGGVIYTGNIDGKVAEGAEKWRDIFTAASGYAAESPEGIASYRGFTDWFVREFDRPAFTVEAGLGKNPLGLHTLDGIYAQNRELIARAVCGR